MAVGHAGPDAEDAGLNQRVLHAGHLLAHGLQRLPYDRGAHPLGTKVTDFLELKQVGEGKSFGNWNESCTLPADELVGGDMQDTKDVRSTVSIHVSSESPAELVLIIKG